MFSRRIAAPLLAAVAFLAPAVSSLAPAAHAVQAPSVVITHTITGGADQFAPMPELAGINNAPITLVGGAVAIIKSDAVTTQQFRLTNDRTSAWTSSTPTGTGVYVLTVPLNLAGDTYTLSRVGGGGVGVVVL